MMLKRKPPQTSLDSESSAALAKQPFDVQVHTLSFARVFPLNPNFCVWYSCMRLNSKKKRPGY